MPGMVASYFTVSQSLPYDISIQKLTSINDYNKTDNDKNYGLVRLPAASLILKILCCSARKSKHSHHLSPSEFVYHFSDNFFFELLQVICPPGYQKYITGNVWAFSCLHIKVDPSAWENKSRYHTSSFK